MDFAAVLLADVAGRRFGTRSCLKVRAQGHPLPVVSVEAVGVLPAEVFVVPRVDPSLLFLGGSFVKASLCWLPVIVLLR